MDRLCEEGKLVRYKEPNQNAWYYQFSEENRNCHRHMHAQCSSCGRIFHLEKPFVDDFTERIRDLYGLDVSSSRTIIIGRCSACGAAEDADGTGEPQKKADRNDCTEEKGKDPDTYGVTLNLPYNMDGILINSPAMLNGLTEADFLSELEIALPEETEESQEGEEGDLMEGLPGDI
jgi:hypothetical protein